MNRVYIGSSNETSINTTFKTIILNSTMKKTEQVHFANIKIKMKFANRNKLILTLLIH